MVVWLGDKLYMAMIKEAIKHTSFCRRWAGLILLQMMTKLAFSRKSQDQRHQAVTVAGFAQHLILLTILISVLRISSISCSTLLSPTSLHRTKPETGHVVSQQMQQPAGTLLYVQIRCLKRRMEDMVMVSSDGTRHGDKLNNGAIEGQME